MKKIIIALTASSVVVLAGCATIVTGTSQKLSVQALDSQSKALIKDATCTMTTNEGSIFKTKSNPGSFKIRTNQGPLHTECVADGYHQTSIGTSQDFNSWTIADIIFWPGFIVDVASGSFEKYPTHITVLMNKS